MNSEQIREELDELVNKTESYDKSLIPSRIFKDLNKWKWGGYGWISPVSLMITATWHKFYYPDVDCCKIWAADEHGKPIPGGYSIRGEDEKITIPIFAKYDLCEGFCSPNSGMQGSRAIEKMRSLKRINRDFNVSQKTYFDLKLFASILNEINELTHAQLLEVLRYFICVAKAKKVTRVNEDNTLKKQRNIGFNVVDQLSQIHDPELTKCVVAACFRVIYSDKCFNISGVDDYKTAADARAKKPGDLSVDKNGESILAIEVKDKTQKIDWNNIERAKRIIKNYPKLKGFIFVLESRDAATSPLINEIVKSSQLMDETGKIISIMSLFSLYQLVQPLIALSDFVNLTNEYITEAPAIKTETKKLWVQNIERLSNREK